MSILPCFEAFADDAGALDGVDVAARLGSCPVSLAVGTQLVRDVDLPSVRGFDGTIACLVTGGAGQVLGPVEYAERHDLLMNRLELPVRDLDDPVGAVRRLITVARDLLEDEHEDEHDLRIGLPPGPPDARWLAAADEVAALGHPATLTAGPGIVEAIDAILDRELAFTVRGTEAVGTSEADGAVRLLLATQRLWDGGTADLDEPFDPAADLNAGRRWFDAFWATDVAAAVAHLESLGAPR